MDWLLGDFTLKLKSALYSEFAEVNVGVLRLIFLALLLGSNVTQIFVVTHEPVSSLLRFSLRILLFILGGLTNSPIGS